jgi:rhodanese-related sulfurtransferase
MARFASVDELLADARSRLARVQPSAAYDEIRDGARIVDIRPSWQRRREGEIPGSIVVERNHLEWRLHPRSDSRLPSAAEGQRWIVVCSEGYTSSLAADALLSLGIPATDIVGGFTAWRAAGLPTSEGGTPIEHVVPGH